MATSNKLRALNRLPYDFQDGLKVGGVDVTALNQTFTPAGAGLIGFTPVGNLAAGNVQAALAELESEKVGFARLDDTDGSSLVGYDGGTVQDVLDSAKPMADYTVLRAYTGRATSVRITSNGLTGFFYRDDADTTSADNGGTIIVAGNGKRWKRLFDGAVNVKWFGAKGDSVTDDTLAIQSAINYVVYFKNTSVSPYNVNQGGSIFIPSGKYRTTDTIHLGYGVNGFNQITLFGETQYGTDQSAAISGIIPDFVDRPAINIQGGRFCKIRNIAVTGKNFAYLYANYAIIPDTSIVSNWYGPNISSSNNTRYAPYAGITIDAYSTARPATSYPDVSYPSWMGAVSQYNKNYSSHCYFENVTVQGFVVGILQSPYVGASGNGDFTVIRDCYLSHNVVGFGGGNSDSRNLTIANTRIHFSHTAIDGLTYGGQNLLTNILISASSFDNIYQLLNVETDCAQISAGGQGIQFNACYSEILRTFGRSHTKRISGTVTQAPGIVFNSCKWIFVYRSTEYTPNYLLDASGTIVEFNNTLVMGGFNFYNFNCKITGTGIYFDRGNDIFGVNDNQAARVASSYTAGVMAQEANNINVFAKSSMYFDFGGVSFKIQQISSNGLAVDYSTDFYYLQRGLVIPWFVQQLRYQNSRWAISGLPDVTLNRATYNLTSLTKNTGAAKYKNEYVFTVSDSFITDTYGSSVEKPFAVNAGDIVIDDNDGHVFFVAGVSFGTGTISFRLRQITGVKNSGTSGTPVWETASSLSDSVGLLRFKNSRRYYPAFKRLVSTMSSGTATITASICGSELTSASDIPAGTLFLPVTAGDYLISSPKSQSTGDSVFPYGKISSADSSTGVITVSQNARRNYYGDIPLFIKGSVAGTAP